MSQFDPINGDMSSEDIEIMWQIIISRGDVYRYIPERIERDVDFFMEMLI